MIPPTAVPPGLYATDLHRVRLMVEALYDALDNSAECGCAWRALDAGYARSDWLLPERTPDGERLAREFVLRELDAFATTVAGLLEVTGDHLLHLDRKHKTKGARRGRR